MSRLILMSDGLIRALLYDMHGSVIDDALIAGSIQNVPKWYIMLAENTDIHDSTKQYVANVAD